jgi:hypothetical protein
MNRKTVLMAALGAAGLGLLILATRARRVPELLRPQALQERGSPTTAAVLHPAAPSPELLALGERIRNLEERTLELDVRREEERERETQRIAPKARGMARGHAARWSGEYKLRKDQVPSLERLFERWITEDSLRGDYGSFDPGTFQAREAEIRGLLTPEQLAAREKAVREQIPEIWASLSWAISRLRDGMEVGPLGLGPPALWRGKDYMRGYEWNEKQVALKAGVPPLPPGDPNLLGECPPIPDGMLLADAHELGLLGLWRRAQSRAQSLLTAQQFDHYSELLPPREDPPGFHHGY